MTVDHSEDSLNQIVFPGIHQLPIIATVKAIKFDKKINYLGYRLDFNPLMEAGGGEVFLYTHSKYR